MKTTEAELQQLSRAVAEAEGWTEIEFIHGRTPDETVIRGWHPPMEWNGKPYVFQAKSTLPDYPFDRNAIIEAIVRRFVTGDGRTKFERALMDILGRHWLPFDVATATAEQLCRAYLSAAEPPAEGQPK